MSADSAAWAFAFLFWVPFLVRGRIDAWKKQEQNGPSVHAEPNAHMYVWLHALACGMQYTSMGMAIHGGIKWALFPGQAIVGAVVVVVATALASWVMVVFRTWRIKAELADGHELCTDGPFRVVRHPIYTAMLLQAVRTAIWLPNPVAGAAIVAMFIAGNLRAESEERLLLRVFGEPYRALLGRTKRFIPGIY